MPRPYGWLGTFVAMASPCEVHVAGADRATAERVLRRAAGRDLAHRSTSTAAIAPATSCTRSTTAGGRTRRRRRGNGALARLRRRAVRAERRQVRYYLRRAAQSVAFRRQRPRAAARGRRRRCSTAVGWKRVRWKSPELTLLPGMQIDFGGIGKEYAVDRAAALVRPLSSNCLLNFGGDLLALGPLAGGRPWGVGIESLTGGEPPAKHRARASGRSRRAATRAVTCSRTASATATFSIRRQAGPSTMRRARSPSRRRRAPTPACSRRFALLRGRDAEAFLDAQRVKYWALR